MNMSLRDMFKNAEWNLAETFPSFLEHAPRQALSSIDVALDNFDPYLASGRSNTDSISLPFRGFQINYVADESSHWDAGATYHHEAAVKMIDALQCHLEALASDSESTRLEEFVDLIAQTQSKAVIWRRLLRVGKNNPATLGVLILALVEAEVVLVTYDTSSEAGEFIKAIFPLLDTSMRQRIEEIILQLDASDLLAKSDPIRRQRIRDRLLGCIPPECVVSPAVRLLIEQMKATGGIPANFSTPQPAWEWQPYNEDERFSQLGIAGDDPKYLEYRRVIGPPKEFSNKFLNDTPEETVFIEIVPILQELTDFLSNPMNGGLHEDLRSEGLGTLASCYKAILRNDTVFAHAELIGAARSALLSASESALPLANPLSNEQFDEFPSWGSPSPRVEAAGGRTLLTRDSTGASEDVFAAIECLSTDPSNGVRFMVASGLYHLRDVQPELMWRLIDCMIDRDSSTAVLFSLAHSTIRPIVASDVNQVERAVDALERIMVNGSSNSTRKSQFNARHQCLEILLGIYHWFDHPKARDLVFDVSRDPLSNADDLTSLCFSLRHVLAERSNTELSPRVEASRNRAWAWYTDVCENASRVWRDVSKNYASLSPSQITDEMKEGYQALARLLETAARELYFASGVFDAQRRNSEAINIVLPLAPSQRFLAHSRDAIVHLSSAGLTPASHHLIELLAGLIDANPVLVFDTVSRLVKESLVDGYQYESLGASVIVRIVERYLADYRDILRDNENCQRQLIELLDAFVYWPQARKLAYRLGEVYR